MNLLNTVLEHWN